METVETHVEETGRLPYADAPEADRSARANQTTPTRNNSVRHVRCLTFAPHISLPSMLLIYDKPLNLALVVKVKSIHHRDHRFLGGIRPHSMDPASILRVTLQNFEVVFEDFRARYALHFISPTYNTIGRQDSCVVLLRQSCPTPL